MLQPDFATPADMAHCRQIIKQGSKSFHLASLLLPTQYREHARSLYGFCRMADDLVDESGDPREAVKQLHERLDLVYARAPGNDPTDRAFADVVHRFAIPRAVPEALIEGFVWDALNRDYETLSDVLAYGVRVAGTVGIMMSLVMGVRDEQALARAIDLGVAMQLSNIARDVVEDAGRNRVYLPAELLRKQNISSEDVRRHPLSGSNTASELVRIAEDLYSRSTIGIAMLPKACRASINAARLLYREIGLEASAIGHARRAVVSKPRKLALVGKALVQAPLLKVGADTPCLDEAAFLIKAVSSTPLPENPFKGISGQVRWVFELFEAVEARRS